MYIKLYLDMFNCSEKCLQSAFPDHSIWKTLIRRIILSYLRKTYTIVKLIYSKRFSLKCPLCLIFISQKTLFLVSCYDFQKHTHLLYTITIFCIFSSVGNWYNFSELVFCMEVKILLGLHFGTFTTHKCMFSATFSVVKHLTCTLSII